MREVTDASFEQEVLGAETPVVVDFWAPWCRPCRGVGETLEQLESETAGRVRFVMLDVDANMEVAARYGVLSLPTVILFDGGEARERIVGARPRRDFERLVAAASGS